MYTPEINDFINYWITRIGEKPQDGALLFVGLVVIILGLPAIPFTMDRIKERKTRIRGGIENKNKTG